MGYRQLRSRQIVSHITNRRRREAYEVWLFLAGMKRLSAPHRTYLLSLINTHTHIWPWHSGVLRQHAIPCVGFIHVRQEVWIRGFSQAFSWSQEKGSGEGWKERYNWFHKKRGQSIQVLITLLLVSSLIIILATERGISRRVELLYSIKLRKIHAAP